MSNDEFQPEPSREIVLAGIRRVALRMNDFELDTQVAVTNARRNVAAAYSYAEVADLWLDQLLVLDEVRRERKALSDAMDEAASPVKTREMTDAEMAAWDAE